MRRGEHEERPRKKRTGWKNKGCLWRVNNNNDESGEETMRKMMRGGGAEERWREMRMKSIREGCRVLDERREQRLCGIEISSSCG